MIDPSPHKGRTRVVVVGLGNILLRDEGVGVHVAWELSKKALPPWVEIIDGGTSPDVIYQIETTDRIILVDATSGGGEPGSIYHFPLSEVRGRITPISAHDIGLIESLKLLEYFQGQVLNVSVIGIEPADVSTGTGLSAALEEMLPDIVVRVEEEIYRLEEGDNSSNGG